MNQTLVIAISILLGSIIIAGAVILKPSAVPPTAALENSPKTIDYQEVLANFLAKDIIREEGRLLYGNEDAKITIVEFSDLECPYCALLEPTLRKIVDESDGKIVWEHRHLPLPIHPHAMNAAFAGECVTKELGNEAFWNFSETIFNTVRARISDKTAPGLSNELFTDTALSLGVDSDTFAKCLASEEIKNIITADMALASDLKIGGTPFSVIIDSKGKMTPVEGAVPYETWASLLSGID